MKRNSVLNILVFLTLTLLPALAALAVAQVQKPEQATTVPGAVQQGMEPYLSASRLLGKEVRSEQGDELGKVEDVVLGRDGRSDFLVLARGGFLGFGGSRVPIPAQSIMSFPRESSDGHLVANLTKKQLDKAPKYKEEEWPTLRASEWEDKVYGYYGIHGTLPSDFPSQRNRDRIEMDPGRGMPETTGAERLR